jgi:hypothetical protein
MVSIVWVVVGSVSRLLFRIPAVQLLHKSSSTFTKTREASVARSMKLVPAMCFNLAL